MVNQTIVTAYENYLEEVSKAEAEEARRLGGLSRIFTGKSSKADELLPAFDAKLHDEISECLGQNPDSVSVRELAEWMISHVEAFKDKPKTRFALMAMLRHLIPLTGFLNGGDAKLVVEQIEAAIPRRERFPVIEELIKKLKNKS